MNALIFFILIFSSFAFCDVPKGDVLKFINDYVVYCNEANVEKIADTVPEGGVILISNKGRTKNILTRSDLKSKLEGFYSKINKSSYIYSFELKSIDSIDKDTWMLNVFVTEVYILKNDDKIRKTKYIESVTIENINGEYYITESYKFPKANTNL